MSNPSWRVDDCEGTVGFSVSHWPTVQLLFSYEWDIEEPHVINLTIDKVDELISTLQECRRIAVENTKQVTQ